MQRAWFRQSERVTAPCGRRRACAPAAGRLWALLVLACLGLACGPASAQLGGLTDEVIAAQQIGATERGLIEQHIARHAEPAFGDDKLARWTARRELMRPLGGRTVSSAFRAAYQEAALAAVIEPALSSDDPGTEAFGLTLFSECVTPRAADAVLKYLADDRSGFRLLAAARAERMLNRVAQTAVSIDRTTVDATVAALAERLASESDADQLWALARAMIEAGKIRRRELLGLNETTDVGDRYAELLGRTLYERLLAAPDELGDAALAAVHFEVVAAVGPALFGPGARTTPGAQQQMLWYAAQALRQVADAEQTGTLFAAGATEDQRRQAPMIRLLGGLQQLLVPAYSTVLRKPFPGDLVDPLIKGDVRAFRQRVLSVAGRSSPLRDAPVSLPEQAGIQAGGG